MIDEKYRCHNVYCPEYSENGKDINNCFKHRDNDNSILVCNAKKQFDEDFGEHGLKRIKKSREFQDCFVNIEDR